MNKRAPNTIDFLILNVMIELTEILLPPFLINRNFKAVAPTDFLIVALFVLIYVLSREVTTIWSIPKLLFNILLLVPILLLLWQKMYIIGLLLFMQYIIYLMSDRTPQLNNQLTQILAQVIVPLFLSITTLDTVAESMSIKQVALLASFYLIKIMFSFPIKNFLDFLWPFIGIITTIVLFLTKLITLPALILMLALLILCTISYPKRKQLKKFPSLLLILLALISLI